MILSLGRITRLLILIRPLIILRMTRKSNNNKYRAESNQKDPIQAAIDEGIDVSMLKDNLQRSVTERIRRHQIALNTANKIRNAKRL